MFPVILRASSDYFSKQQVIIGFYNAECVLCELGNHVWYTIKAVPWLGRFVMLCPSEDPSSVSGHSRWDLC